MATFAVRTKNNVDIREKTRVYFTCHPDDFEPYFDKICEALFTYDDCAIYYTPDMTEEIDEESQKVDIGRQNLVVCPVTRKLLTEPNRAMDDDLWYVQDREIPLIPIMMETGLDEIYGDWRKFGERQYLNAVSEDETEISFAEKLRKFIEATCYSGVDPDRVRDAFDGYVFLSYRKKDRKYANELMSLIHSRPELQGVAVWFDEFLSPGESYRNNIDWAIRDCSLFLLLATPRTLERVRNEKGELVDNYVISTEIPTANRHMKEILAVVMEEVDCTGIPYLREGDVVAPTDADFFPRIISLLSESITFAPRTPEREYLLGLAYLEGIDVEVDRELGVAFITRAAQAGCLDAMEWNYRTHLQNEEYDKAAAWAEKLVKTAAKTHGKKHETTIRQMERLVRCKRLLGQTKAAFKLQEKICGLRRAVNGKTHEETFAAQNLLASLCEDPEKKIRMHRSYLSLMLGTLGEEHPQTLGALYDLAVTFGEVGETGRMEQCLEAIYADQMRLLGEVHRGTVQTRNRLIECYRSRGEMRKAAELIKVKYEISTRVMSSTDPDLPLHLYQIAKACEILGETGRLLELSREIYALYQKNPGEEHPDTVVALNNLAVACGKNQRFDEAIAYGERAYELRRRMFGERAEETLVTLTNLAAFHYLKGDLTAAKPLYEALLDGQIQVFGEDHERTRDARKRLCDIRASINGPCATSNNA